MKRLVETVDSDGFDTLLGKKIVVWCMNYFYSGKLIGVNEQFIQLDDACVVYETGELTAKNFKDAQPLPHTCFVRTSAIESYSEVA
jgi:hypothetical protein